LAAAAPAGVWLVMTRRMPRSATAVQGPAAHRRRARGPSRTVADSRRSPARSRTRGLPQPAGEPPPVPAHGRRPHRFAGNADPRGPTGSVAAADLAGPVPAAPGAAALPPA